MLCSEWISNDVLTNIKQINKHTLQHCETGGLGGTTMQEIGKVWVVTRVPAQTEARTDHSPDSAEL